MQRSWLPMQFQGGDREAHVDQLACKAHYSNLEESWRARQCRVLRPMRVKALATQTPTGKYKTANHL